MLFATSHNRYLIYQLLNREVEMDDKEGFSGIVQKVCRDIFQSTIELTISGRKFSFDEPAAIYERNGELVFAYGNLEVVEDTDEQLFEEIQKSYGDSVDDVLRRTRPSTTKTLRFSMGGKIQQEKRRWRRRD